MHTTALFYLVHVCALHDVQAEGFSDAMIKLFFRPFMGGIFFNRELTTSSRLLTFVLRTLALGSNSLPEKGIGAVPEQMAARLPAGSIHLSESSYCSCTS